MFYFPVHKIEHHHTPKIIEDGGEVLVLCSDSFFTSPDSMHQSTENP